MPIAGFSNFAPSLSGFRPSSSVTSFGTAREEKPAAVQAARAQAAAHLVDFRGAAPLGADAVDFAQVQLIGDSDYDDYVVSESDDNAQASDPEPEPQLSFNDSLQDSQTLINDVNSATNASEAQLILFKGHLESRQGALETAINKLAALGDSRTSAQDTELFHLRQTKGEVDDLIEQMDDRIAAARTTSQAGSSSQHAQQSGNRSDSDDDDDGRLTRQEHIQYSGYDDY